VGRKVLKVYDDFYKRDLKDGEIVSTFEGKLKIIDLHYQNEYGEFILCETVGKSKNRSDSWETQTGKEPDEDARFKIIGTIHVPNYRNLMGGMGFYVKDHHTEEVTGLSYPETWKLVFREGTKNAFAMVSNYHQFTSRLIETVDELPSLDSHYWKISAYREDGELFAPLTKQAEQEVKRGLRYVERNRQRS
jgi:hypothetical protein